ncbi:alpha-glucosidase [Sulfodiicoccus acidiphilus]|uniref:Alpha-glucosidase n=1 Tax=Sulfodiicoccus acidiphilus TaxID=1670455 RepID=A0A348B521_9CREN|nr:alpha-glucosidase MalA [Sulfodiicoccus acidiphilus]BBD73273.1 alpha-glucosidase [Sulfodiicoccus acidiphilus]GGT89452.1 alpha-glucosidase [Sulfodiicoccus acidiphilus]
MPKVDVLRGKNTFKVSVNDPRPVVEFPFKGDGSSLGELPESLDVYEGQPPSPLKGSGIVIQKKLGFREHVLGLGEKAFELDRRRITVQMWNTDVGGVYFWYTDPMYKSINFLISVTDGKTVGYFVNSASRVVVDVGNFEYDKLTFFVPERSAELFVFQGKSVEEVVEAYTELTGKPFLLPEWALGYQISRYSYYPQDYVVKIVEEHLKEGFKVSAVYLDIDYMDKYRMFTWDRGRFPDPAELSRKLHSMGVKLITIVSPCLKVEQGYGPFAEALGCFVERPTGEIYVDRMWPGHSAWIDFLNERARSWWKAKLKELLSQGVDAIWLDMNEPAVLFKESKTIDEDAVHTLDDGRKVPHAVVHNAYGYYEAQATYAALRETRDDVFVLSRAAYAGSQKYTAVWTGDNVSSWDDLRLQLVLIQGLSVSGVPYVGCDIGGFSGRFQRVNASSSPELLVRFYEAALFFPLFRNHKAKGGVDQEPYNLPDLWKEKVRRVVSLRYAFLPYLSALVLEAHEKGHPIVRPLAYHFQDDENVYRLDDEFMVGSHLLQAPIVAPGVESRKVYLPRGRWSEFWTGKEYAGPTWADSVSEIPLYAREGAVVPMTGEEGVDFVVYGDGGELKLRDGTIASTKGRALTFSGELLVDKVTVLGESKRTLKVGGKRKEVKLG